MILWLDITFYAGINLAAFREASGLKGIKFDLIDFASQIGERPQLQCF
jgi:hypothetical protein